MDLNEILEELRRERERLAQAIAAVETLHGAEVVPEKKRRGRTFMPPEERREVSARMRKYWASRLR